MKNRKKLVITLIGVIVLGIGLFVYQTFIKKQLHFKENMTVEINGKFNPNSYISEVEHGSVKDVACQDVYKRQDQSMMIIVLITIDHILKQCQLLVIMGLI